MKRDISLIGVGSPIVDLLAQVEDSFIETIDGDKGGMVLVNSDQMQSLLDQLSTKPKTAAGGSAGNTTFALAELGSKCALLAKVGNDASAEFYKSEFEKLGGDIRSLKQGDIPNGRCLSLVTPDAERTMRTDLGAAMTLSSEEVSISDFQGCKIAHVEGYVLFNRDLMLRILESAKAAGCKISVDLASFEVVNASKDILKDLLSEYVDIVFANEDETRAFLGEEIDFKDAAKTLATLCDIAAVKLGAEGSIICRGDELVEVAALKVDSVIDTTGAGDYWAAGFLYGYMNGKSLVESAQLGSALGAEVVQVMGAKLSDESWNKLRAIR